MPLDYRCTCEKVGNDPHLDECPIEIFAKQNAELQRILAKRKFRKRNGIFGVPTM